MLLAVPDSRRSVLYIEKKQWKKLRRSGDSLHLMFLLGKTYRYHLDTVYLVWFEIFPCQRGPLGPLCVQRRADFSRLQHVFVSSTVISSARTTIRHLRLFFPSFTNKNEINPRIHVVKSS